MPIPVDTAYVVEIVQLDILRRKSPQERLMLAEQLTSDVILASKAAIARVHPGYTSQQISDVFVELHYGVELARSVEQYRENLNATI